MISIASPWIQRPNPAAKLRIFCFPHAGGGSALLHLWLNGLPAQVDMCPILLPGRERRRQEPAFRQMSALVPALVEGLMPLMDRPYAFFGHSLGSLMAFELTRELRRRGMGMPVRLFLSAHASPQVPRILSPIHHLPEPEFIDALIQRYDAIPEQILSDRQLLDLFLPVLRADMEILETYHYQPDSPLACPISALGGVLDSTVTRGPLEAWREQTFGDFRLHLFPGNHFYLKEARPQVLRAICTDLSIPFEAG